MCHQGEEIYAHPFGFAPVLSIAFGISHRAYTPSQSVWDSEVGGLLKHRSTVNPQFWFVAVVLVADLAAASRGLDKAKRRIVFLIFVFLICRF